MDYTFKVDASVILKVSPSVLLKASSVLDPVQIQVTQNLYGHII